MKGRKGSRLVVLVSVVVVMLFAASVAIGASSTPTDKSSAAVSPQEAVVGPVGVTPVVYVATGSDFPDALGAGPVAGITDGPILLVQKTAIPVETQTELTRLNPDRIVIIGGTGVVSAGVATALGAYAGTVERLSGANRYATAAAVSAANFPAAHQFTVWDYSNSTTQIGATCAAHEGAVLPITVPGPGTITVETNVNMRITHTQGSNSWLYTSIGTSPIDCIREHGWGGDATFFYMDDEPTGVYFPWGTMKKILHVDSAGTYTFYTTGYSTSPDPGFLFYSFMDATFIPDPGT